MLLRRVIAFFTSLRLTVVCLCLGLALVFFGTLAQVDLGLYRAQNEFFRSIFVYWGPKGAGWKIPVLPGGYLVGLALVLNLIAAYARQFTLAKKQPGILMIHTGLILLLLGQLLTDLLSVESVLHLRMGESRNYSEELRRFELAITDKSDPKADSVVVIPESRLASKTAIRQPQLPFELRVKRFLANSEVSANQLPAFEPSTATRGHGVGLWIKGNPKVTSTEQQDIPTALVEIASDSGAAGQWLVSGHLAQQSFSFAGRTYQMELRPARHYKPFSLQLLKFNHAVYHGTDIPKDFSSRIRLLRPSTGENREVLIYMNSPLRYDGETFYQSSFDRDDAGTILQVVHNPSWLAPYLACGLIGFGMLIQFLSHLLPFLKRSIKASPKPPGNVHPEPGSGS